MTATVKRNPLLVLAPLIIAFIVTTLIILVLGHSPASVYTELFTSPLSSPRKIADTLVVWVSLAIVASGLLITFRAGQWNIGIEGQIGMGAIFAYGVSRFFWESSPFIAIPAMLIGGIIGGMLWGLLAGLLKVYGGVNEIFGGLALNFVTTSLTIYMISIPWKPEGTSSVSASELMPESIWLPTLGNLRVSPVSLIIAILVGMVVYRALNGTLWGLQLKAVGRNVRGAYLLGVPTNRVLLSAYLACGACAGLTGAFLISGVRHQLVTGVSSGYGFLGILVVLLAGFSGVFSPAIALFFAFVGIGGTALPIRLQIDSSLGGVLVGMIVLSYELVQGYREKYMSGGDADAS